MTTMVKIDATRSLPSSCRPLKLTGQFERLIEQFVRDRLTVLCREEAWPSA